MSRRVWLLLGLGGLLVCGGCGRRAPEPMPEAVGTAPDVPATPEPEPALLRPEPYVDATLGIKLDVPVGWSVVPSDDAYTLRCRKDRAEFPAVEITATPKADYLEIQKMLEVEQHPAAARVKAIAKELTVGLTDGLGQFGKGDQEAVPEIVSDDIWTTDGIIAGRCVKATDGAATDSSQGEMRVGESAGGALYAIYCLVKGNGEQDVADVKQLLDSLSFTEPSASPAAAKPEPSPAAGVGTTELQPDTSLGDPADGIDAGAGADAAR